MAFMFIIAVMPMKMMAAVEYKTTEAAYATPIIDGQIDDVWSKTNANILENCRTTGQTEYKGWFKVLWDENNLYVLMKIYDNKPENVSGTAWVNDSVDIYVDENYERTKTYQNDDYQLRIAWDGLISGNNYHDFTVPEGKTSLFENGYIAELAFPLKQETIKEGMTLGFDVQSTAAEELGIEMRCYIWNNIKPNNPWVYNNPSGYGTLNLKRTVDVKDFKEPEWIPPSPTKGYCEVENPVKYELVTNQTVSADNVQTKHTLLLADDYPMMEISELAEVIGGTAEGYVLTKGDTSLKFTDGERLAEYSGAHLMLEREAVIYNGKMYVPVSCIVPTMLYTTHYNKFESYLEIWSGTAYPESEVTVYAKDFGAVGDGETIDGPAILKAVNAAINSGRPATVMLEPNRTYFVGERADSNAFLVFDEVENITFEGNGSTLLFEKPVNTLLQVKNSKNIKIRNVSSDYVEHTSTQGRITDIDYEKGILKIVIDEGLPLPAANDWVDYYYPNQGTNRGGFWISQFYHPEKNRMKLLNGNKYINHDCFWIEDINPLEGEREYEVVLQDPSYIHDGAVGDRLVINTRTGAYDVGADSFYNTSNHAISITYSGDIVLDGVTVYGAPHFSANCGLNWGRIIFRNYGMKTKDGRLLAGNSDGIHYWRNRAGIVLENSTMMNNLDDHLNTKGEWSNLTRKIDDYTYNVNYDLMYRPGDELLFFDSVNHKLLGNAFIKSVEVSKAGGGGWDITVDRKIDNVKTVADNQGQCTTVYNIDCSGRGSVVRNTEFVYSRRHAYITRSANSIFMNNKVIDCGGSAVIAKNEIFVARGLSEGPFPSSFTMINNFISSESIVSQHNPVEVKSWEAKMGDSAMIDGFLMENNEIKSFPNNAMVKISHAKDVYLINNSLTCDDKVKEDHTPVLILNSEIKRIDNLKVNYKTNVPAAITIIGCKYDSEDITNIDVGTNTAELVFEK